MQHLTTGMRLEDQLLMCVARGSVDTATAERIHLLVQHELDWNYLLDSANSQGMIPLLYRHLSSLCPEAIPKDISRRLKDEFIANSGLALFLTSELQRIIKLLENDGICAVGFKGPLLSLSAYGDVALRQAGDLDILIERGDLRRAKAVLDSEGYAINPQLSAAQQSAHVRSDCEILFIHAGSGCVVDLHWELAPKRFPFPLNSADLFSRLQTITFGNNTMRTFSNEDLLVFLCMHGAKHLWSRLEWVSSLAELIRNSERIDWTKVVEQARKSRSLRRLLLGLMLARRLQHNLVMPEQALVTVPDSESLKRCAAGIEEGLFQIRAHNQLDVFLFNLQVMDGKCDAVVGLLRSVLVPTISDWQAVSLPNGLYPLYYLLRPMRLAAEYSAALGQWIRTRKRPLMKSPPLP